MLVTLDSPERLRDVMDLQPERKSLRMLVMPWVFVRITCPVGQGDHPPVVEL